MGLSYWCTYCTKPAWTKTTTTDEWVCKDHYKQIEGK